MRPALEWPHRLRLTKAGRLVRRAYRGWCDRRWRIGVGFDAVREPNTLAGDLGRGQKDARAPLDREGWMKGEF
jgi:hypothetical protein